MFSFKNGGKNESIKLSKVLDRDRYSRVLGSLRIRAFLGTKNVRGTNKDTCCYCHNYNTSGNNNKHYLELTRQDENNVASHDQHWEVTMLSVIYFYGIRFRNYGETGLL